MPDGSLAQDRPFLCTSATVESTYATAIGVPDRPDPLSPTSPSTFQPEPNLRFFRHAALPSTFPRYAETGASLFAVHVTTFVDAVAVGLSAPHGLFDATGFGTAVRALSAELRGDAWTAPELGTSNALDRAIQSLPSRPGDVSVDLPGWSPASGATIIKFLANYSLEKLWHGDQKRYAFLSRRAVDKLVGAVKSEVSRITTGREWVSSGDVLTAWVLKVRKESHPAFSRTDPSFSEQNAHADEVDQSASVTGSAVYTLRKMLPLDTYPHNAMLPYPLTPEPIPLASLSSLSVAHVALLHRRALDGARVPECAKGVIAKMQDTPLIPEHSWPWTGHGWGTSPAVFRWISSNQMESGVAELALPLSAWSANRPCDRESPVADMLGYYMLVVSAVKDHQVFRFQANASGVFLEGSMRRRRWLSVERAVRALEQS